MSSVSNFKNYIGVRDFYNFIKSDAGRNVPATFYYFSVSFFPTTNSKVLDAKGSEIFTQDNLTRFRYAIQYIGMPNLILKGFEEGKLETGYFDIDNLFGGSTLVKNAFINAATRTIEIKILNLHNPIIESFILPWLSVCIRNSYDTTPFPRLNMKIKFWSGDNVGRAFNDFADSTHIFEYFITGLFPIDVQLYNPIQSSGGSNDNRSVKFGFNEIHGGLRGHLSELYKAAEIQGNKNDETINKENEAKKAAISKAAEAAKNAEKAQENMANYLTNLLAASAGAGTKNILDNKDLFNKDDVKEKQNDRPKDVKNVSKDSNKKLEVETPVNDKNDTNKTIEEIQEEIKETSHEKESSSNINNVLEENKTINKTRPQESIDITPFFEKSNKPKVKEVEEKELELEEIIPITTGKLTSMAIEDVELKDEQNVNGERSNLSLEENKKIVEDKNIDEGFEEIIEPDDENEVAYKNETEIVNSNRNVNKDINVELQMKEIEQTSSKDIVNTRDTLYLKGSNIINTSKHEEGEYELETPERTKINTMEYRTADEILNELHQTLPMYKNDGVEAELSGSQLINSADSISNIESEKNIQNLLKSYKDNQVILSKKEVEDANELIDQMSKDASKEVINDSISKVKDLISETSMTIMGSETSDKSVLDIIDSMKENKTNTTFKVRDSINIDDYIEKQKQKEAPQSVNVDKRVDAEKSVKSLSSSKSTINVDDYIEKQKQKKDESTINVDDYVEKQKQIEAEKDDVNVDKRVDAEKSVKSLSSSKSTINVDDYIEKQKEAEKDDVNVDKRVDAEKSVKSLKSSESTINVDDYVEKQKQKQIEAEKDDVNTDKHVDIEKSVKSLKSSRKLEETIQSTLKEKDSSNVGENNNIENLKDVNIQESVSKLKKENELSKDDLENSLNNEHKEKVEESLLDEEKYGLIPNTNKINLSKLDEKRMKDLEKSVESLKLERSKEELDLTGEDKKKSPFEGNTFNLSQVEDKVTLEKNEKTDLRHFGISDVELTNEINSKNVETILSGAGDFREISGNFIKNNEARIYNEVDDSVNTTEKYIKIQYDDQERFIPATPATLSLLENQQLVEAMNVDDTFEEILDTELEVDINNMCEVLKDNKSINPNSYKLLNDYAGKTNRGINEVIKQYKASTAYELPKFISDVIKTNLNINGDIQRIIVKDMKLLSTTSNTISKQKEIINDKKQSQIYIKSKNDTQTNLHHSVDRRRSETISSSDIDSLFS